MIIVKLSGGMGNQMFQYAFGRTLSLKFNTSLRIDLSFLNRRDLGDNFVYRNYDLDLFNIEENLYMHDMQPLTINEPHFEFSESFINYIGDLLNQDSDLLFEGVWQSPLYFKGCEEQIRTDFKFKNDVNVSNSYIRDMLHNIRVKNSVLINVRRTDYLHTNFHGVMGLEYINKAKEIIEYKIENPHYFIFSDDMEWCKENLNFENMTLVDHTYKGVRFDYYLQLMSNCKHFIIPNSSFAWWSAWLSRSQNKIVITPEQWFSDGNINTKDLIPDNWIRI